MHRFTLPLALLLAAPGYGDGTADLLCAFTDPSGTIRVFARDGGLRVVAARDDCPFAVEPDLKGLDPVVAAKVIPFQQGYAIALVARKGQRSSYHYLVAPKPDAPAQLSPALFLVDGDPDRIVEILNPSGDSLQIVFSSGGFLDAKPGGGVPRMKVFSDNCASAPTGLVGGKSRLVDLVAPK